MRLPLIALALLTGCAPHTYNTYCNAHRDEYGGDADACVEDCRHTGNCRTDDNGSGKKALRVFGAALSGVGQGLQRSSAATSTMYQPSPPPEVRPAPSAYVSRQCSSDYDCGYGNVCVKPQFQYSGTCAKAVDEYGTPTMAAPRPESIGAGEGNCSWDTECPVGFRCDKRGGGLRGNCMK